MVFPSIPAYDLDPPNWHQPQSHQIVGSSSSNHLLPPLPPQHVPSQGGSIRPGSMAERARLANIPMPETALKCPRCESTNTKFCYFNNYSLSQPRHFCKTCRRYWTRGGALRSVPVGGGCRRNKRNKPTSSKSPASGDSHGTSSSSSGAICSNVGSTSNVLPMTPQLHFTSSLNQITDNLYVHDMGISNPAMRTNDMNFHLGRSLFGADGSGRSSLFLAGGGGVGEPWRLPQVQQLPFLGGLAAPPSGAYQFHGGESVLSDESGHRMRPKLPSSMATQIESVKIEENLGANLSRRAMDGMPRNDDQWNASTAQSWADLSVNFNFFSTSNAL